MFILQFIGDFCKWVLSAFAVETPSPLSPSPCQEEGELLERGVSPLLNTPIFDFACNPLFKGCSITLLKGISSTLLIGSFRGTKSLFSCLPLFFKGEGD